MGWKRRYTTAYVDTDVEISEFNDEQLLQGLIDSKWITEVEAEAILKRAKAKNSDTISFLKDAEFLEYQLACDYIRMGDRREAILHLERYLGRDWIGRLS